MAATFNESQKIDYLWKKVGYAVTKTAEATVKEAFNESIASPLLYRGDLVWMESDKITGTPPAATNSIIQVYKDGVGSYSPSVECTEDLTAPDNQTWKTNITNWVPTQFGDNYLIQVYIANSGVTNPQTSGVKLFQAGSGTDDTWFFDYQSGVLNFNGTNVPSQIASPITGKSVYIVGYRYVGFIGVTNLPSSNIGSNTNIGNLNFTDTTISTITPNSNIYLAPNGYGNVLISTSLVANGNLTSNGTSNLGNLATANYVNISANLYVFDTANVGNLRTNNILYANGSPWDLQEAAGANTQIQYNDGNTNFGASANFTFDQTTNILNVVGNANVGNFNATGTINATGNISGGNITTIGEIVATGNGTFGNISTVGNITGANVVSANTFTASANINANNANLGNLVTSNYANISANLYVFDTANVGNLRTDHILYANGSPWDLQEAAGANTQIQFNDGNTNFGASANFTFNTSTNLLTVIGNTQFNNANLGNLSTANYVNISYQLDGNTANFSGNIISGNANLGNTSIANNVIANTFRMGVGVNEFYHSTVYFATTADTAPNQVLWSTYMANLSAIDFTIISTDETSNTRQTAKIAAAVLGTEVVFNEYSGLYINGGVGSFSVNYQAGPPETIQLVVTPDSTNLTKYNMMIIQYAK